MSINCHSKKRIDYLRNFRTDSLISTIFSYVPIEKSLQILRFNKKYSSLLNLNLVDYYLDKEYQKIIGNSKCSINYIFENSIKVFQSESLSSNSFAKLTSNIIKYLKLLYFKKEFKSFNLAINLSVCNNYLYLTFALEIIRNIKYGLCLKIYPTINFRYYGILKDAIHNLDEIKSVDISYFSNEEIGIVTTKDFFKYFDWTKVKCLNLASSKNSHFPFKNKMDFIPDNASFSKIYSDEDKNYCLRKLVNLKQIHAKHIEHLKIFNFSDKFFPLNTKEFYFFNDFTKLKNIKFINCKQFSLYKFLLFFQNSIFSIQKLILDRVDLKSNDILANYDNNCFIATLKNLTNLEKLEINFNPKSIPYSIFEILALIVNSNQNLKKIKITIPELKNENIGQNENNCLDNDSSYESGFTNFIMSISSLKKISSVNLVIPMNDKMTNSFNNYFSVGESLNELEIIHSGNLNMTQLFLSHPNLVSINFTLICKEANINVEHFEKIIFDNFKMADFDYNFPKKNWKKIALNYYPLSKSFLNTLINYKCSIKELKLNNTINTTEKSNVELYSILIKISKKIKMVINYYSLN